MFTWEKKTITFIHRHILWFAGAAILLLSLYARYSFWSLTNSDLVTMGTWVETARTGGIRGMLETVDYSALHLYLFYLLSRLSLPLTTYGLIKLLFVGFEYLCIGACATLVYRLSKPETRTHNAFAAFTLLCLSPVMVLNAAGWGQCDAMYTLFVVLCVWMLAENRPVWAMVLFGVALCVKLQAIFALPALLLLWFMQRKKSFLYFLILPAVLLAIGLPLTLFGASPLYSFTAYFSQGDSQLFWVTKNYPGFFALWGKMLDPYQFTDYAHFYMFIRYGIALTVGALVCMYTVLLKRGANIQKQNIALLFAWTALVTVYFLPHMHERYGMLGEVLLLCYAALRGKPKYYLLWVLATLVSMFSYGSFLFIEQIVPQQLGAFVNLGILCVLSLDLVRETTPKPDHGIKDTAAKIHTGTGIPAGV